MEVVRVVLVKTSNFMVEKQTTACPRHASLPTPTRLRGQQLSENQIL